MMPIDDFRAFWVIMATRISINRAYLVRDESELSLYIKTVESLEIFMIVVIPSADSNASNADNILEQETVVVYVMRKCDRSNENDASAIDTMMVTQNAISAIKRLLLSDSNTESSPFHDMTKRIDFGKFHTDPEYNYFGCDGYSLSFPVITPGF